MTTTRTDHPSDEQQQPITRSRKNILRPLLIALAAWRPLAVFLSVLEYLSHGELLQQEVVRRRMSDLFIPSLLFLAGPLLLFLVTFGLVRGQWNKVTALGMKTGCGAFALVAIVRAGIAGWAFVNDENPWEALPSVTPSFLEEFHRRNPGLEAFASGGPGLVQVRDDKGRSAHVDSDQLLSATLRFDPCETTVDPDCLGVSRPTPVLNAKHA